MGWMGLGLGVQRLTFFRAGANPPDVHTQAGLAGVPVASLRIARAVPEIFHNV